MPSNFTENFTLSQWEPGDKVQRTDFNADNAAIDTVLGAHAAQISKLGNCRIELLTYTGNGKYGDENPTVIPLSGSPEAVLFGGYRALGLWFKGETNSRTVRYAGSSTLASSFAVSLTGNTMKIVSNSADSQFNSSNSAYHVLALYAEDQK